MINHQHEPGMNIADEIFFIDAVAVGKGVAVEKDVGGQRPALHTGVKIPTDRFLFVVLEKVRACAPGRMRGGP